MKRLFSPNTTSDLIPKRDTLLSLGNVKILLYVYTHQSKRDFACGNVIL